MSCIFFFLRFLFLLSSVCRGGVIYFDIFFFFVSYRHFTLYLLEILSAFSSLTVSRLSLSLNAGRGNVFNNLLEVVVVVHIHLYFVVIRQSLQV